MSGYPREGGHQSQDLKIYQPNSARYASKYAVFLLNVTNGKVLLKKYLNNIKGIVYTKNPNG